MRLEGKVALITGGGSCIGRACAVRFAAEGAAVCAADINREGAAETVRQIEDAGGRALAVQVDTSDKAACEAMVARCVEAFGAVDVLMAAAGILGQEGPHGYSRMLTAPTDLMRRVIDVNLYGVLFSDRAAARWMVANGRPGSIINFASAAAKLPTVTAGGVRDGPGDGGMAMADRGRHLPGAEVEVLAPLRVAQHGALGLRDHRRPKRPSVGKEILTRPLDQHRRGVGRHRTRFPFLLIAARICEHRRGRNRRGRFRVVP